MLHPQYAALLEKLKKSLRSGDMTPTDKVGPGTFVCMTEATAHGMMYHQMAYDSMPIHIGSMLKDRAKGDKVGSIKVVAIFDVWPEMEVKQAPHGKVFDN